MSTVLSRTARPHLNLPASHRVASRMSNIARYSTVLPSLPLQPPTLDAEQTEFDERTQEVQAFFDQPCFKDLKRPYTASQIASKQGTLPVLPLQSTLLADKLYRLFEERASEGQPVHTMGAIDPVQMTQMAPHQEVVYVSGWACSSLLTTCSNEVGPDIGCVVMFPRRTAPEGSSTSPNHQ